MSLTCLYFGVGINVSSGCEGLFQQILALKKHCQLDRQHTQVINVGRMLTVSSS